MIAADLIATHATAEARGRIGESLAIGALVFYVVTNIVFLYCPFLETYPQLIAYSPLALCNGVSLALAAVSIALKPGALSKAQKSAPSSLTMLYSA